MEHWRGIGKVIEECGEVLQLLGKAIPFPTGDHPDGQGEVRSRLEAEIADLYAAMDYFIETNHLDPEVIDGRYVQKLEQFRAWGLTGIAAKQGGA